LPRLVLKDMDVNGSVLGVCANVGSLSLLFADTDTPHSTLFQSAVVQVAADG
jgi:hypothetical protein